jgi:hypothetical protein
MRMICCGPTTGSLFSDAEVVGHAMIFRPGRTASNGKHDIRDSLRHRLVVIDGDLEIARPG